MDNATYESLKIQREGLVSSQDQQQLKAWDDQWKEKVLAETRKRAIEQAERWRESCRGATIYDMYGGDRP